VSHSVKYKRKEAVTLNKKLLGKNIRKYRDIRHMTQAKLAEEVGVADNYIAALEKGRSAPSMAVFLKLVNVLDVTPNHLLLDNMDSPELVMLSELEKKIRSYPTAAKITACEAVHEILNLIEQLQNR